MPENSLDRTGMIVRELNNGRLAMIAFVGIIAQEYLTGEPVWYSFMNYIYK